MPERNGHFIRFFKKITSFEILLKDFVTSYVLPSEFAIYPKGIGDGFRDGVLPLVPPGGSIFLTSLHSIESRSVGNTRVAEYHLFTGAGQ